MAQANENGRVVVRKLPPTKPKGRPVAIGPKAVSASPTDPTFVAPPGGAPAYDGFVP
ncbi:MAG TPA: hypothetical protein VIH89_11240 [Candidatus Sulfotelmatobacter sp.]